MDEEEEQEEEVAINHMCFPLVAAPTADDGVSKKKTVMFVGAKGRTFAVCVCL